MPAKVKSTDFNGPQKPRSAYFIFCDENRAAVMADIKAKDPKASVAVVAKSLGAMWKEVSEEKKKELQAVADKEKAEYTPKFNAWSQTEDYKEFVRQNANLGQKKEMKAARAAAKESAMPTKPQNGYFAHSLEVSPTLRAEFTAKAKAEGTSCKGSVVMSAIAQQVKAKWEALGAEGQKVYQDRYLAAKAQYAIDYAAWCETEAGKAFVAATGKASDKAAGAKKRARQAATAIKKDATKGDAPPSPKRRRLSNQQPAASSTGEGEVEAADSDDAEIEDIEELPAAEAAA